MTRTFDIRFARNSGLAALLEAPVNSFQWKGTGRLSIDAEWLVFARSRSFPWPFARLLRRVPAATLAGVFREGEALRLEFAGSPRLVVPIWARNPADAAEIVRLMPTDRTLEVDEVRPQPKPAPRRRIGMAGVAIVSLTIGVVATLLFVKREAVRASFMAPALAVPVAKPGTPSPSSTPDLPASIPAARMRTPDSPSESPTSRTSSARLPDAAPAYGSLANEFDGMTDSSQVGSAVTEPSTSAAPFDPDVAIPQSRSSFFRPEALALQSEYVNGRTADLEKRWWALSVRLYNSPEFDNWRLRPLIDAQLGVSLNWRVSLSNHAAAIKSRDPIRIDAARAELERANDLTTEVLGYSN